MKMENVEKYVIPLISNNRESFLGLYMSFPWGDRSKKYKSLLSTFRNNSTPSKRKVNESLKTYLHELFNFDCSEQYWVFDTE